MRARICRGSVSRKPEDLPIMVFSLPCSKPDAHCHCNFDKHKTANLSARALQSWHHHRRLCMTESLTHLQKRLRRHIGHPKAFQRLSRLQVTYEARPESCRPEPPCRLRRAHCLQHQHRSLSSRFCSDDERSASDIKLASLLALKHHRRPAPRRHACLQAPSPASCKGSTRLTCGIAIELLNVDLASHAAELLNSNLYCPSRLALC